MHSHASLSRNWQQPGSKGSSPPPALNCGPEEKGREWRNNFEPSELALVPGDAKRVVVALVYVLTFDVVALRSVPQRMQEGEGGLLC